MSFLRSKEFSLILLSSLLFVFAFPPSPFFFLAYFFLVPLFFLLGDSTPGKAFKYGYFFGVITNALLLYWIIWQTFYGEYFVLPGSIGAYLILALYPACWSWLLVSLKSKWKLGFLAAPFLWVAMEYLRGLGQIGFPWLDLGYTQTGFLPLIQFASFTGIQGVSGWVVVLNVFFYLLLNSRARTGSRWLLSITIVILLAAPYLYGRKELSEKVNTEKVKVALIQGNIDPTTKWNPEFLDYNIGVYDSLSRLAGESEPELIIWPETACPCYLEKDPLNLSKVENLSATLKADIVTGTDDYFIWGPDKYVFYNSAFRISPDSGLAGKYYKMQLVPFAEKIPYSGNLRMFEDIELGQANFSPGKEFILFESVYGRFPALICYEMAFPNLVRKFAENGADFLVNITNDGWFGRTAGPYQHASMSVMRAVENRIGVARCANTGISTAVDPYGRILNQTQLNQRTILLAQIPKRTETTFFSKHGPWLGKACLAIAGVAAIFVLTKRFF